MMAEQKGESGLQKMKRTRKGTPKAKWGCTTCKIRHVKCDENKPACHRCTSTGRLCDFLQPFTNHGRPAKAESKKFTNLGRMHPLLPKNAVVTSTPVPGLQDVVLLPRLSPPPSALWMNSDEGSYFDYFRTVSIHDLSGYFEDPVWNTLILQAAYLEPSIKHAAIAVGAWNRSQAENKLNRNPIEKYAMLKYLEAVKTLNQRLDDGHVNAELVILASLLFMALETFQGADQAALAHFEGAFAILQSLHQQNLTQNIAPLSEPSLISSTSLSAPSKLPGNLEDLTASFTRLDIQASTFAKPYKPKPHTQPTLPLHFTSLSEARVALDSIVATMHYILGFGINVQDTSLKEPSMTPLIASTSHIQALFISWDSLFNMFLAENRNDQPHHSVSVLKIQLISAQVHLHTFLATDQAVYDNFYASFSEIVDLAETIIPPRSSTSQTSGPYSFHIGIIQPLYFVALKCRDRILRRRAHRVLMNAGREGVWDGKAMAAVIGWVIEREEEGLEKEGDEMLPEGKRFNDIALSFNRAEKRVKMIGIRRGMGLDVEWEYSRAEVEW